MRFGITHRVMTGALAALAALGLLAGGRLDGEVTASLLAGLSLAFVASASWARPWPRRAAAVALLLVMAAGTVRLLRSPATDLLDGLVVAAATLQILRLATRGGAAHDQQIVALALFHLFVGTLVGDGIGYGLCLLGVLVVAPGALLLSHLRREVEGNYRQGARDRTGLPVDLPRILRSRRVVDRSLLGAASLLSIPIVLLGLAFFAVIPRAAPSLFPLGLGSGGVDLVQRVDLGGAERLRRDPALFMRVRREGQDGTSAPARLRLYLRGTAFDVYDGRAWSQSARPSASRSEAEWPASALASPAIRIDLQAIDPPLLFVPLHAAGVRLRGGTASSALVRGPEDELRCEPRGRGELDYEVVMGGEPAPPEPLDTADRARYLALPGDLPARVRTLAADWTRGAATPLDRARAIEGHLRSEYRYDLDAPSARARQPLDHFLFEAKRGHCQFHATAMAVLRGRLPTRSRRVGR
jgi:hypothetical protein